jgi:hypothetical protein
MGKQKSNQIRSSIRDNNSVAAATYFKFSDIICVCAHATPAWKASKNLWTTSLPYTATNNNNK